MRGDRLPRGIDLSRSKRSALGLFHLGLAQNKTARSITLSIHDGSAQPVHGRIRIHAGAPRSGTTFTVQASTDITGSVAIGYPPEAGWWVLRVEIAVRRACDRAIFNVWL